MRVDRAERERVRAFYRDVLDGEIVRLSDGKDDIRLDGTFYIAVLYEDAADAPAEDDLLKSTYLELRADNVGEVRQRIVDFGVKVLDVPDPHLYFQAPGGQVFRLTGIGEDLARYEGTEHGQQFVGTAFTARAPGGQG
jgi:hypothetical protein